MTTPPRSRRGFSLADVLLWVLVVGLIALALSIALRRRRAEVGGDGGSAATAGTRTSAPAGARRDGAGRPGGGTAGTADALPVMAKKPAPVATGFQGCPPQGDGGDPALNRLKNRVDSAAWLPAALEAVVDLPWPRAVERRQRRSWRPADAAEVARSEGLPVAVEGYLAGAKVEGPESPNCHGADTTFRDWHLWLAATPGRDRTRSIVVETTPVVRAQHPGWTRARINRLVREGLPVRVSGWLLLDPEHPDQVGKTRGTIWEIHPIMRMEAQVNGRWVMLDSLPDGGRGVAGSG